jgi:hypothetical protein
MTEFKKWEDYTPLEQAATIFSDFYKDVNGIRPRFTSDWTLEQYDAAMDDLEDDAERERIAKKSREQDSIIEFENGIDRIKEACNCDRETAWRFMKDAEGDVEYFETGYFEYSNSLPYGYLVSVDLEAA